MRSRASTVLSPPKVPTNPAAYTRERIQEGIDWAYQRLDSKTRKVSPLSEKLFLDYVEALSTYLEDEKEGFPEQDKEKQLFNIRAFEEDIGRGRWHELSAGGDKPSWAADIIQLKKYQLFARYGDYLGHICYKVRGESQKKEVEGWAKLSGTRNWTDVSMDIKAEDAAWKKYGSGHPDEVKTTYAIWQTCLIMAFDFNTVVEAIHGYADRDKLFHSGLGHLAQEAEYSGVAKALFEDIKGLESFMSVKDAVPHDCISAILFQLKEQWFEIDNEDTPGSWIPKSELRALHKKPEDDEAAKKARKEIADADVLRGVMARIKEAEESEMLEDQLRASKPATGPSPKRKTQPIEVLVKRLKMEAWGYVHAQQGLASEAFAESEKLEAESEEKAKESLKKRVQSYSGQREVNRLFSYLKEKHDDKYGEGKEVSKGEEGEIGEASKST